jgi:hypothetical protein
LSITLKSELLLRSVAMYCSDNKFFLVRMVGSFRDLISGHGCYDNACISCWDY